MAKPKRLDGITHLTAEQKAERDARAQYWMNQRKIERVAEAAYKHGWFVFNADQVEDMIADGWSTLDDQGNMILVIDGDGEYRLTEYHHEQDSYLVRKVKTYPRKGGNGSNTQ